MSRIALDTNVLVYREAFDEPAKTALIKRVLDRLDIRKTVVPVQVLGELHRVLVGKLGLKPREARTACEQWSETYIVYPTTQAAFKAALSLVERHRMRIWDAIILSVAAEAGCRVLLSEDVFFQDTASDVTIVNPFSPRPNALLDEFLGEG